MGVSQAVETAANGNSEQVLEATRDVIAVTYQGKPVKCKTIGQKQYIQTIRDNTVTICIGPAGTGKTYLAIAMAVAALKRKEVSRIILTRPAVEAGEKLGFLPGDLQSKVDPYLRPLYDALFDFLGQEQFSRNLEKGVIEVAPIAYMRGRTLNDAFIILDEGQNATLETLKMVLTRFGEGSHLVLTGDITQIDLSGGQKSGLKQCAQMLRGIDDIGVIQLTNRDVVRHKLVKEIIKAFEKYEKQAEARAGRNH
ncbi:MAG: PhoH family protein [Christensenellales bacterium]